MARSSKVGGSLVVGEEGKNDTSSASANLNRSRSLKAHGSGVERTIPAELPPGEYVVDVHVTEPQGGASYFFRVMVE